MKNIIKTGLTLSALLIATSSFAAPKDYIATCSTDGFTGVAKVHASRTGPQLAFYTTEYKISGAAGAGRNKANLNIQLTGLTSGGESQWIESNDNLQQNDQFHSLSLTAFINEPSLAEGKVQFIFDKKGGDPKCVARVTIHKSDGL